MEQVPNKRPYGLIGSGRAARHFARYLALLNIPFKTWARREDLGVSPAQKLQDCGTLLLLIRDGAIDSFIQQNPEIKQHRLVHFSGALTIKGCYGTHPLTSFGHDLENLEYYEQIVFVSEKADCNFKELFPELSNTFFSIEPSHKPLYHALCVLSGNFSVLLWQKLFEGLRTLNISEAAGQHYLQAVTQNILRNPGAALTGPLARGDQGTLTKNFTALEGDPFQRVYAAFTQAFQERNLRDETHSNDSRLL